MPSITAPQLKLQSADGEVFEVAPHIYKSFTRISLIMQDSQQTFDDVVPVPNVNACSLWKVLRWAEYHMDDDPLEENDGRRLTICEWDQELLQVEKNMLMELVLAANYLGVQGLLDAACIAVISLTQNEQLRIDVDGATMDDDFVAEQQLMDYFDILTVEYDSDPDDEDR